MSGSTQDELYDQFITQVPDQQLIFMNHGFANENDDFSWIEPEDSKHRYPMNLIRFALGDIDLSGKAVLEVGSGRGGNCSYLARYTGAQQVTGLEYCAGTVAFCRGTHPHPQLDFIQGDAQLLPFADASFDVVVNIESSHCYPNLKQFIQEAYRVLKSGGYFCYADVVFSREIQEKNSRPDDTFEYANLQFKKRREPHTAILKGCGFDVEKSVDITDNVIASLEKPEGNILSDMSLLLRNTRNNDEFVQAVIDAIGGPVLEGYRRREATYHYWRARKPGY